MLYSAGLLLFFYRKDLAAVKSEARIITGRTAIISLLNSVIRDSTLSIDFRVFYFLEEHKVKLLEAIKFWDSEVCIENNLVEGFENIFINKNFYVIV